MQERHVNRQLYFDEQGETTRKYVIPFISKLHSVTSSSRVLEIGCGEGGNMAPFLDMGCQVMGIDINQWQIENAHTFYKDHPHRERLTLLAEDIYKVSGLEHQFDIIILRDVIEHIPHQERFMAHLKQFIAPGGIVFIGFPPWQNPFGGHQQICSHRVVSRTPWIHLLPRGVYKYILCKCGIGPEGLLDIKDTGISLERFLRIVKRNRYRIVRKELYLINPNYETKFGFRPRKVWKIAQIPYLRNFYTTCGYYLLENDNE